MRAEVFPDGEGLFETILTVRGVAQLLEEHIARARDGAARLGYDFPTDRIISEKVEKTIFSSSVKTVLGRLRLIFNQEGDVSATLDEYQRWTAPATITVSNALLDETSPISGLKKLPYRSNLDVLDWARNLGFDDAIRFNKKGEVTETSVANLLFKFEGTWSTPPLASGALPGIVRALALTWLPVQERTIMKSEIDGAESIYLLNSLKGFQPVASVDHRALRIDDELSKKAATLTPFGSVG